MGDEGRFEDRKLDPAFMARLQVAMLAAASEAGADFDNEHNVTLVALAIAASTAESCGMTVQSFKALVDSAVQTFTNRRSEAS